MFYRDFIANRNAALAVKAKVEAYERGESYSSFSTNTANDEFPDSESRIRAIKLKKEQEKREAMLKRAEEVLFNFLFFFLLFLL